jgi:hypothetical protein
MSVSNDRYYKPFIFCIIQIILVVGADTKYRFPTDTTNNFCSSVTESCVGNGTARALDFLAGQPVHFCPSFLAHWLEDLRSSGSTDEMRRAHTFRAGEPMDATG